MNFYSPTDRNSKDSRPLVIFGAGGHAVSVANVAISAGYKIKYFVDDNKYDSTLFGFNIIKNIADISNVEDYSFSIAVGDNYKRELIYKKLISINRNLYFPIIIHKNATISSFCEIQEGVVVMPNSVVGPATKLGKFCLINTKASLDHESRMMDFSSLAPSVVTGGNVQLGKRTAICMGAVINHGINIGDDCVVGASSFVNKDIGKNNLCYGIPAKIIRKRNLGEPYL